jgi:hypothetical protein
MKTFCVMLLSALLLAAQWAGGMPTGAGANAKETAFSCCPPAEAAQCNAHCCLTSSAPAETPLTPNSLPPTAHRPSLEAPALLAILWTLPLAQDTSPSLLPPDPDASTPPGEPLYLRHSVLLI